MVFYALRAEETFFLKLSFVLITLLIRLHFLLGSDLILSFRIRSHSETRVRISLIVRPESIANVNRTLGDMYMAGPPRRRSGLCSS